MTKGSSDGREGLPAVEPIDGFDAREWLKDKVRATPWWAISIGFHGMLIAALGLIQFAQMPPKAPEVIRIGMTPTKQKLDLPEKRSDLDRPSGIETMPPAEDPAVIPDAILDRVNETDNNKKDKHGVNVESDDPSEFINAGFIPGLTKGLGRTVDSSSGISSVTGVGASPNGGGRFGPRGDGGSCNRTTGLGNPGTQSAVRAGLRWLARHQASDGSWRAETYSHTCAPGTACEGSGYTQFDVGVTALSTLAFLGAGYTHFSRDAYLDRYTHKLVRVGDVVRSAERFLVAQQDQDGCFGARTGEFMYNHAIATLAIVEAYGMSNAASLRTPAERAIEFLVSAQNPYRGWRYSVKPGDNDTSVTGWCVMALKSAIASDLPIPHTSFDGARAWIDSVTDDAGMVGYSGKGKIDTVIPGKNDAWRSHPAMTAVGLLCRIFIDRNPADAALEKLAKNVSADLPRWEPAGAKDRPIDFYYWYYGALALFQYDAPNGRHWRAWNEAMKTALVPTQATGKDGCADGSWDPTVDRWGFIGGRVYATAINTLSLEVYYRYAKVEGAGRARGVSVGGSKAWYDPMPVPEPKTTLPGGAEQARVETDPCCTAKS